MAGEHVLIVDDDADLVSVLSIALESAGYRVSAAGNEAEGWSCAKADPPDVALVDIMMDTFAAGIRLVQRFRADAELARVPVIVLTAVNERLRFHIDAERDEGYLPADRFLEKPVDPHVLLAHVAELVDPGCER